MKHLSFTLNAFDKDFFLANFWQKKPCLIKQGIPGFETLVNAEELAGMACEEGVESRLITGSTEKQNWTLQHGPFDEEVFHNLPEQECTLLVQKVDHLIPEITAMGQYFDFIPSWRFDDVMISFAEDQGSVGPHIDNYDVFLLQGMGQRKWQIEASPILEEEDIVEGVPLRVLKKFTPDQEWILEPGDILYIPPRWAHHGVSLGRGMTYSFGYRSPSIYEMFLSAGNMGISLGIEKDRYSDPDLKEEESSGEISELTINRVKKQLRDFSENDSLLPIWFGTLATANQEYANQDELFYRGQMNKKEAVDALKSDGACLKRSPEVKWAFYCDEKFVHVFIHGQSVQLPLENRGFVADMIKNDGCDLVKGRDYLCGNSHLLDLLSQWLVKGYVYCE